MLTPEPSDVPLYALLMRLYSPNPQCRAMLMYRRKVWEYDGPCVLARITYYANEDALKMALVPYRGPTARAEWE